MGRRRSGRRRRSSQGDGGRTQSKSPITSQPGSPATTSLATSPQSACADSAFGVESQTTLNSSRTAPPNSPGTGSCEDGIQTEWTEANMGEHATDRLGALDAPVHAARARVIDSDMEDEAVVRLTETPESKRRSLKVSHSEKIFAKKVLVTADEDVNVKIKGARDNADPKLLWSNDKGRHPEEKVDFTSVKTGQAVRRIAEKISLFENRAASTAKSSSSNLRSLEISPARKVADRLREFSEHAGTRTTSVPSNQTVKERAANFTAAQKGEVKSTPAFGKAGVIDHPINGGHSKTTDQTETSSENTPNTEWTETSRDKPEIKFKPPSNLDQTDSKSHNATEVVPALSENDSKLGNKEVKSCLPQPVTSPTDEIPQAKPLSRTGSRSKRRRSKDVSQPLSPISANKEETLQDKQEVKETDRKNTSAPKIPSKPPMDKRDAIKTIDKYFKSTSEKVTTNSAGEKTVNKKPKVPPKLVKTQKIEHSTENTPDTDSKRLKLQQTDTKCLKEMKGTDKKDRENKDCFENKTVSSEPQTLISPTSRENNSQCENSSNRKQTEQKNINPESEKQHKNCNNKQLVQETSEREDGQEKTNRDTIVNTLFEESGKPDPSVTNEEKPPSPETLKETDYKDSSKPANSSHATSRRDAMQNGKSTTNKEFLPENNKATCEPKMKIAKPEEVQTVKSSPEERDTYRQTLDSQEGQMLTDHCSADVLAHPGMTERDTVIDESLVDPTNSDAYKSDSKAKVKVTKPSEEKGPVTEATNQHKERATVTNENEERKSKNKIKYKSKEKVCLTENSTQNEKKDVAKTTDQNMEIKTTETPKPSHENNKSETTMQNIAEEMITKTTKQDKSKDTSTVRPNVAVQEHTTITANSQEKSNETQNIEKDTSTGLTNQNTEEDTSTNLTNQHTKTDISTGFTNENGDVHMNGEVHLENTVCLSISPANKKPISLLHTANDSSINKPDQAKEKTPSLLEDEPSPILSSTTNAKTIPPPVQKHETPTSLPASTNEKVIPTSTNEKTLPDSAIEKTTPPLDRANEDTTIDITPPPDQTHEKPSSFPVSTNEETKPLPASTNEKSSILPDSAIEKTTSPSDSANKDTTIDITPPPDQTHETPSSFSVSTNEDTIPSPASTNEKISTLPDSAIEKTTSPSDSANEKTTFDITPPSAQIDETPTSLPTSNIEKNSPLPDSAIEKTTPPLDWANEEITIDITPPPAQIHETPSSFPVSTNEETIPLPASTNEKSSILPDSAIEKTTPPSDSTTKKTTNDITPPPDQTHETPSSFPVSINEETIPLPASTNEKSSILPDSEAKKTTPPSDSANKDTTIDITPPSDLANEKTTSDITPAQTHETLTSLPVSTNEKTIPPPALTNEKTSTLPDLTNEKISSPPASTNGKITTLPVIKKTTPNKKTTPPLDSTIEKINIKKKTPPSNSANKTTTIPSDLVIEKTPNQKIIPPLKSIHETATIPSGSAVESTHPPSSTCEITSILPVSSNEKTTPPHDLTIKKTTNSNSTALLDLTIEQTTPPSHLTIEVTRNEMDTPSPDLYVEQTTNEKTTIPVDSTVEKTTPPPASSNEITSTLPASTNKITSPPPDLIKEATSTLPASTNEETMPTSLTSKRPSSPVSSQDKSIQENTSPLLALSLPTSTNKNTTHPPVSNDETVSLLTKNERVMPLPASANENQKQFLPASTNGENKTPPPSVKEKTVPSPDNAKTLPSPASINEKIKPPPASANGKVSHPTTEQYPPSVSPTKPQSSDPATRKKKFVMKPFKLPQIPSARGTSSLNKDSLSSWLDVDHQRPVKKKQFIPEPKAKHSSPVSKTKLNTSGEYDPDDFIANVKRLAMPFSLPQRKHNHHRLHVPPMPAIKEDEKPFDPEEFQVGLRRRREFTLDLIPSARSKLKHTDPKEEDTTAKRINPERESILMRSLLFKNAQKKPVKKEEGSNEKKIEPLVRSRLERCSILNSLRTTSRDRKMEILSPTETPSDKVLSPTDSPDSSVPPEEQSAPAAESPTQDTADEAKNDKMDSSSCTNTGSQVVLQPTKDNDPIITPDPKTTSENSTVTVVPDSAPLPASCTQTSSEEVLKPDKEDVQVITTDLNTTSAQPTVTTVTDLDAPPPLPSFNDIKLPSYLDKFLPKEPETAQASNRINPQVARESASTPGLVDLNKTVDKEAADSKIAEVKIPLAPQLPGAQIPHADHQREQQNVPAVRGFHRRPGKIVIFEGHQFTGRSFEFYGDQPDCSHLQLSSVISLKVVRGCWVLYEKPGYEGRCIGLEEEWIIELPNEWAEEAEQTSAPMVIGSMRLVVRDYSPPCIELFTEHSGRGRSIKYEDDTQEVSTFGLPMNTGSIKVHSGLWLIYSDPDFQGLLAVLETGEYPFPEIWGFPSPTVGSLRPLRMGGLKVENPNEVKAVLYEEAGLKGRCVEVQGDVFSFGETQSDNHGIQRVESLKILGGLWLGFEHEDFEGQQFILEEGEYLDWKDWGGAGPNLLSLRPVLTDFSSPHIKMFREPDFAERGINVDLMEPLENAANTQYGPQTQSIDVLSGVWVAFEEPGFSGQPYVLEKGLYSSPEDWGASSNRITSVLPVTLENIGNSCHFKMELFSEPEFCGSSVVLEDSLPTMPAGFTVLSCKVLAGSWLAFSAEGFSGSQCVLEEGDYLDLSIMGFTQPDSSVLSLKPVGHEFSLPSIVLFERSGLRGRRTVLKSSSVNLQLTNSCTRVSSILVEGGMWVLYEGNNFRGSQILLKPGEVPDWPKLSTWQRIGSLRPLIQKQVHFRLRNEEAGLLMSVTGSNDDIKLMRIQVTEETAGVEQIWFNQDGHLHCKWLTDCCVDVSSGVLMPGSRAVLSAEPGKPQQLWNFTQDGFIRNNAAPGLVLDVKGGQQFDKNQIILSEFNPNKPSQRWALELL